MTDDDFARIRRMTELKSIEDCLELNKVHSDFMLSVVLNHTESINSPFDGFAKLILQMMLTKCLAVERLLSGFTVPSASGIKFDNIIDPTIIGNLIRNVYETTVMFNTVFTRPKTPDERKILLNLWKISGLNFRQKFASIAKRTEANTLKLLKEQQEIVGMIKEIENTNLYKSLNEQNRKKIQTWINDRKYHLAFKSESLVHCFSPTVAVPEIGVTKLMFDGVYNLFSLYAHPSYVAAFQFNEFFDPRTKTYESHTCFLLRYYFIFQGIFLADFLHVFPYAMKTFDLLPLTEKMLLKIHNDMCRDNEYSIQIS